MKIRALTLIAVLAAGGFAASGWAENDNLTESEADWVESLLAMQIAGDFTPRDCILLSMLNPGAQLPPECEDGGAEPGPETPGEQALTVWWVVFNHPEHCATSPCGEPDLFEPDVGGAVFYATGAVSDEDGNVRFVASAYETDPVRFADTDPNTAMLQLFGLPAGPGLLDADEAEIHLVVRVHGPAAFDDPELLTEQLSLFLDSACDDARLEPQGRPNECEDIQFAVFPPGESGASTVHRFADASIVEGASVQLLREPGAVKFILETRVE